MRGDKSFAYDLIDWPGHVSSRVALLLRSAECKPVAGMICFFLNSFIFFNFFFPLIFMVYSMELGGEKVVGFCVLWV